MPRDPVSTDVSEPVVEIRSDGAWYALPWNELWVHRELLYFLVWRDVKVRYKQSALGASWAILQPLLAMLIFTVIFGYFAKIPSDNIPYPVFSYAALLPWLFFAQALTRSGGSLVGNSHLVTKVYFPRLILPLSAVLGALVDFAIAFVMLLVLAAAYGIVPGPALLALPLFLLLALGTALGTGLWLSALNVRYHDVGHALPFLVQLWMYASPVVYPTSLIPERWRIAFALNPMTGVIDGFRWSVLGAESPDPSILAVGAAVVVVLNVTGFLFFRRAEKTFADVV
jgi:lipopolysaccharide transport system permease protein